MLSYTNIGCSEMNSDGPGLFGSSRLQNNSSTCLKMPLDPWWMLSQILRERMLKVVTLRFSHTLYCVKKYTALSGLKPRSWWLSQKVISAR